MPGFMGGGSPPDFLRKRDLCRKLGHEVIEHQAAALPPSPTPSLPDQLLERGAVPAVGLCGEIGKVGIGKQPLKVPPQDSLAPFRVRQRDADMSVEPAGTDERGVEAVRVVASPHHHDAFPPFSAVDALEQRGDDLGAILGVVVAEALPVTNGVDLVQEDDRRRDAKIWLEPAISVADSYGFNSRELARILEIVALNRRHILRAWNEHFADGSPL